MKQSEGKQQIEEVSFAVRKQIVCHFKCMMAYSAALIIVKGVDFRKKVG